MLCSTSLVERSWARGSADIGRRRVVHVLLAEPVEQRAGLRKPTSWYAHRGRDPSFGWPAYAVGPFDPRGIGFTFNDQMPSRVQYGGDASGGRSDCQTVPTWRFSTHWRFGTQECAGLV